MKRGFDCSGALLALLFLSPLLGGIGVALRLTAGPPVFFRQQRPGLMGKPFTVLKFRTMNDECDERGALLDDKYRLTKLGRFLRVTSLDELPQLINVVKGEMSLVGPRPLLMEYLSLYTPEQSRRHQVRPGITGLAQVSGRQDLTFSKRFAMDSWYVDHLSFCLDMKVLFLTAARVITGLGVKSGQAVSEVDDLKFHEKIRSL
ncbi:MAG: sugar transferase [Verrucomicrobia bacterium]|nr:sugar transferase [Verrucomicrobiota bacterium]